MPTRSVSPWTRITPGVGTGSSSSARTSVRGVAHAEPTNTRCPGWISRTASSAVNAPESLTAHERSPGAPAGGRTQTEPLLRRLPLPVGIPGPLRRHRFRALDGSRRMTSALSQGSGRRDAREVAGRGEEVVEHRRGQPAGERVVLRRVVAAEQRHLVVVARQADRGGVAEPGTGPRDAVARSGQGTQGAVPAIG